MSQSVVPANAPVAPHPPKLLDLVRQQATACRLSPATIDAYVDAVRGFILFHGKRHPRDLGAAQARSA